MDEEVFRKWFKNLQMEKMKMEKRIEMERIYEDEEANCKIGNRKKMKEKNKIKPVCLLACSTEDVEENIT